MKLYRKVWGIVAVLLVAVVALAGWYLHRHALPVLQPAGQIGRKERNLMLFTVLISVVVVVPVFIMLGVFAYRYREGNERTAHRYSPDMEDNHALEAVWWAIPAVIIGIISVVTWRSSYALDPFKPLAPGKPALHVQVVALDWKWLFIYPDQGVASVNEAAIPVGRPVDFEITSDAVMTSFWVPQLGGQMYAMPGMSTQLNLEATRTGSFFGSPANISGRGFADMDFAVKSMSQRDFSAWLTGARRSDRPLTTGTYDALARPSTNHPVAYYSAVQPQLYNTVVVKYMTPSNPQGGGYALSSGASL